MSRTLLILKGIQWLIERELNKNGSDVVGDKLLEVIKSEIDETDSEEKLSSGSAMSFIRMKDFAPVFDGKLKQEKQNEDKK